MHSASRPATHHKPHTHFIARGLETSAGWKLQLAGNFRWLETRSGHKRLQPHTARPAQIRPAPERWDGPTPDGFATVYEGQECSYVVARLLRGVQYAAPVKAYNPAVRLWTCRTVLHV